MNCITITRINKMKKNMVWRQKTQRNFTTKNWDILMIISTSLKKKKNNRLVKGLMKKYHLKNQQKMIWTNLINGLKKQAYIVNYLISILNFKGPIHAKNCI